MFDNFYMAVQAAAQTISLHFSILIAHPFFWGFCAGFLIAAIVSVLIITNNPIHVCTILLHKDPRKSFSKISKKKKQPIDFRDFQVIHTLVRFLFLIAVLLFLMIVLISLVVFSVG